MRVYDEAGKLLTIADPLDVAVTVIKNEVSAYKRYVLNSTDNLYYEILCDTDSATGLPTMYLSNNGVAIPIQIPPTYLRNATDNLYYEILCSTDATTSLPTMYLANTGISIP